MALMLYILSKAVHYAFLFYFMKEIRGCDFELLISLWKLVFVFFKFPMPLVHALCDLVY